MKRESYKKSTVLLVMILFIGLSFSPMISGDEGDRSNKLEIIVENISQSEIHISAMIPEFKFSQMDYENEKYTLITIEDEGFSLDEGQAKLPKIRRMIEIPQGGNPDIIINDVVWEETSLHDLNMVEIIFPLQPSVHKTGEENEFAFDADYYNSNQFHPEDAAIIFEINQIRGRRFALVEISPVQYNPSTGELKLMISCDISIQIHDVNMDKTIENIEKYSTEGYEEMFSSLYSNYGYYESYAQENKDPEGFLIIVHDEFNDEITPLANWKTTMGYDTTVTLTSEIPGGITTNDIQAYIQDAYDTWTIPPAYILLVGDTPQIPAFTGSHSGGETDTYYVTMDGTGDLFADIHIGRFPAETEAHVVSMVDKTIYYEQGVFPDIEWIKKAVFIASSDHGLLAEETHNYCIDTWMEPNGYNSTKIYQASGGDGQDIYDALNDGRSICIYSGHGGPTGWGCVPFSNTDVYALENDGEYPFVCSHACSTSTYEGTSETFSEAWVRAENKGGIAMWGSSVSTYWDEDDAIQRRVFDAWWNDSMVRIGQMTDYGMFVAYQQNPGLQIDKFIESYNVMGDASVKIWTDDPFVPDHDITVVDITIPDIVAHGEPQIVSSLVKNSGNNTETGIVVDFMVNDTVIDTTTIASLDKMETTTVSFPWNPAIGTYLVAIESQPIPDEYDLLNNQVNKTVSVIAAPAIDVTPSSFTFLVPTESSDTDILTIENLATAEGVLEYSIVCNDGGKDWLSANPLMGTIAVDDTDDITITVNTSGLDQGDYQGNIIINSNDLDDAEVTVPVYLTVVYGNDMKAVSINSPTGVIPAGSYVVNATVQNLGSYPQTGVLVNCSIFEGGIGGTIIDEDFSSDPVDWTITHIDGTAWTWDSSDQRMENTYGYPNAGYLDSPVLDCSGKTGISLSFWHYWKADYSSGDQDGYVRGSIDGGDTFPFLIDEFHHNDPADETAVKYYDISSWADGQSEVMVRFDIWNDNDWYWRMDDFNVSAEITGEMVYYSEQLIDIGQYESKFVEFTPAWDAILGLYGIQITTLLSGDESSGNDVVADVVSVEGPGLAFSPGSFDFGTMGVNQTDSTSFEIWNDGVGLLTYSLSETCDWIDIAPLSGDSTGETDTITVDINTTGLPAGSAYHCDIMISSNGGSGVFGVDVYVVSSDIEILDVDQPLYDRGFPVRHAIDGDWAAAQDFTPTLGMISSVELYMRVFGSPEFDLTVELRSGSPDGVLIDSVVFTPGEVPSSWDWLHVDFADEVVSLGVDYFVVIPPAPSGVTTSFGYEWGYAIGNPYPDGSFWFTRDGGGLWRDLPDSYEFAFRTYGLI